MASERPQVMGTHEIAQRLGVTRQRIYQIVRRGDFPPPVAHLALGKVWLAGDVEDWITHHYRGRRAARR